MRNGTAPTKANPQHSDAATELQKYRDLMREAGSPNGTWNPDPDEQISGVLRDDVELSPNEIKLLFLVKSCCLRQKPMGRTAWGFMETGKPLRDTEVCAFFGWDPANVIKWAKRPLAYGFIRKNVKGQYGIGARVQGKFVEPEPEPGSPSEVDLLVCTDKLPRYLAEAVCSQLADSEKLSFLQGWRRIKSEKQQELNTEKQRIYDQEQQQLDQHCKAFEGKLPSLKRKDTKGAESETAVDFSVQTSSVQNGDEPLYNASAPSVPTTYIRKQSKGQFLYLKESSSSEQAAHTTTTQNPSQEESAAVEEFSAAIRAHGDTPDRAFLLRLWRDALGKDPALTKEEATEVIHERAKAKRSPGLGFYREVLLNCLPIERVMPAAGQPAVSPPSVEEQIASFERLLEASPAHPQAASWRAQIEALRRKPVGSEPAAQGRKAGQA